MKILFCINTMCGGGAERVMSILVNDFVQQGHSVTLMTNINKKVAYRISPQISIVNLNKGCPQCERTVFNRISRYLHKCGNIRTYVKTQKPDLVVSFMTELNISVLLALIGVKVPIICSEHSTLERTMSIRSKLLMQLLYPLSTAVTVLTRHDYKKWKSKYRNLVYLPNPLTYYNASQQNNRKNVVLAVGRLDVWHTKGFDMLCKAWTLLPDRFGWQLHIAGEGSKESVDIMKQMILDSGCDDIKLLGFRDDIMNLYSECAVFCLSSRHEGLPMALLEAMSSGCCCVAYDCMTGPREIITNNINGILVPELDVPELSNALYRVISNSELRLSLVANNYIASNKYSRDRVMRRWKILIELIKPNENIVSKY